MYEYDRENYMASLNRISTVDGRESFLCHDLENHCTEGELHRCRAKIMIDNMIAVSESKLTFKPTISEKEKEMMRALVARANFDPRIVAEYDHFGRNGEKAFEHDVKAVEFYLRELLINIGLGHLVEWLHFGMTSEDNNNLAHNLMLRGGFNNVWLKALLQNMDMLAQLSVTYANDPVAGITHECFASPTTAGKRFSYELHHLTSVLKGLQKLKLSGKYGGATGNHNPMLVLDPDLDMIGFSREFVEGLGFVYEENTHQRNSHLAVVELFNHVKTVNTLMISLSKSVTNGMLMGWISLDHEGIGSSIMPHKVPNPWRPEVAVGYLEQSNDAIDGLCEGLIPSTFERDAHDHPYERSYGEILAKSLIGIRYMAITLEAVRFNAGGAHHQLSNHTELLSEAIQTCARAVGVPDAYMKVKGLFVKGELNQALFMEFISTYFANHPTLQDRLYNLTPTQYTGYAKRIAEDTVVRFNEVKASIKNGILDPALQLQAVLFDFDKTLQVGDKQELHAKITAICETLNMPFSPDEIEELGNHSDWLVIVEDVVTAHNNRSDNKVNVDQFQEVTKSVSGKFDHHFELADDAQELLDALVRTGKKIGLVTTRGDRSLTRLLDRYGITNHFDAIINRSHCGKKEAKPHPRSVFMALNAIGVEPSQAMFVGDKQYDDIIAGKAAGLTTVLINEDELDQYGAKPDFHFSSLSPLVRMFERLEREQAFLN